MKEFNFSIKNIVAIGIGSAIFIILARFGSIPTGIPNTNFEISYVFLALMAIIYGPISGFAIGFIGHTLKDMLFYGVPWFSWVIASAAVGFIIGYACKKINLESFKKPQIIQFNIVQVIANIIAWIIIAPIFDILIYAEPINKVFFQGTVASIANIISIGLIGTSLIILYSKTIVKKGSLSKES